MVNKRNHPQMGPQMDPQTGPQMAWIQVSEIL